MIDISRRRPGLNIDEQGNTAIHVWAPFTEGAALVLNGTKKIPLRKTASGYWHTVSKEIRPGDRYRFELGDGKHYPDPASLSQPEGVHGPSEVIRLNGFEWSDDTWKNPPLSSYIFYELHTGTFTPQGNFAGRRRETTTPIARITRSPGSIGHPRMKRYWPIPAD